MTVSEAELRERLNNLARRAQADDMPSDAEIRECIALMRQIRGKDIQMKAEKAQKKKTKAMSDEDLSKLFS